MVQHEADVGVMTPIMCAAAINVHAPTQWCLQRGHQFGGHRETVVGKDSECNQGRRCNQGKRCHHGEQRSQSNVGALSRVPVVAISARKQDSSYVFLLLWPKSHKVNVGIGNSWIVFPRLSP